jgi:hypothetical protein
MPTQKQSQQLIVHVHNDGTVKRKKPRKARKARKPRKPVIPAITQTYGVHPALGFVSNTPNLYINPNQIAQPAAPLNVHIADRQPPQALPYNGNLDIGERITWPANNVRPAANTYQFIDTRAQVPVPAVSPFNADVFATARRGDEPMSSRMSDISTTPLVARPRANRTVVSSIMDMFTPVRSAMASGQPAAPAPAVQHDLPSRPAQPARYEGLDSLNPAMQTPVNLPPSELPPAARRGRPPGARDAFPHGTPVQTRSNAGPARTLDLN